ncbi:hypothetical protein K474DRAFT_1614450 [Panus rudis PR-1116 ss-1]|nr:hypothetical protein K474DRAFT_1614450 [Panus rudis PR-1116 ss-1]
MSDPLDNSAATLVSSDSELPPRKRARTADLEESSGAHSGDAPPKDPQRHENLWFPDGNVVLISTDDIAFRLHKSVLGRHSSLFRDMFTLPQPQGANTEEFDGCPAVRLQDSGNSVAGLISIFYDGPDWVTHDTNKTRIPSFMVFAMLMDMAHKYQVEPIRLELVRRLEIYFPRKLHGLPFAFDLRPASFPPGCYSAIINMQKRDAVRVILLAQRYDMPQLLPTAYYTCSQLPTTEIPNHLTYVDGYSCRLGRSDIKRCIQGKEKLSQTRTQIIITVINSAACGNSEQFNASGKLAMIKCAASDGILHSSDVLDCKGFNEWLDGTKTNPAISASYCLNCWNSIKEAYKVAAQEVFQRLDVMYHVKGWSSVQ